MGLETSVRALIRQCVRREDGDGTKKQGCDAASGPASLVDAFEAGLAGSLGAGFYAPGRGGVRSGCYSAWVIRNGFRLPQKSCFCERI